MLADFARGGGLQPLALRVNACYSASYVWQRECSLQSWRSRKYENETFDSAVAFGRFAIRQIACLDWNRYRRLRSGVRLLRAIRLRLLSAASSSSGRLL